MKNIIKQTYLGLNKSRKKIMNAISFISGKKYLDQEAIDHFEELLISSDIGVDITDEIIFDISKSINKEISPINFIKNKIRDLLGSFEDSLSDEKIIQVVGVNGVGKTTFCAKVSQYYKNQGENVLIIGADTYRAAASHQIKQWAEKYDIKHAINSNSSSPSSIIYDALQSNDLKSIDRVIIDTAGRLHTSKNLMQELKKMETIISKFSSSYSNWIVLDSIMGQNSINQISLFNDSLSLKGIVLNKMDSSSKGGVIIPIMQKYNIPVKFIGIGEGIDDLIPFEFDAYLNGLIGTDNE